MITAPNMTENPDRKRTRSFRGARARNGVSRTKSAISCATRDAVATKVWWHRTTKAFPGKIRP
jgi:hypothetical protein